MTACKHTTAIWLKACVLALGLFVLCGVSPGGVALAEPGDVRPLERGALLVQVPNRPPMTMRPMLASAVGGAMRYDDDATAQRALMQVMRQAGPEWLEAVATVAAYYNPERASLISAAAMETDPEHGLKAAQAMRHVRGVRKQQILLGVHSSGNRQAYKDLRRSFRGRDQDSRLADQIGRSVGPASADDPRQQNPLGFGKKPIGRGVKILP